MTSKEIHVAGSARTELAGGLVSESLSRGSHYPIRCVPVRWRRGEGLRAKELFHTAINRNGIARHTVCRTRTRFVAVARMFVDLGDAASTALGRSAGVAVSRSALVRNLIRVPVAVLHSRVAKDAEVFAAA